MAYYLVNRSPSTVIDCKTPFEIWSGTPRCYVLPSLGYVQSSALERYVSPSSSVALLIFLYLAYTFQSMIAKSYPIGV